MVEIRKIIMTREVIFSELGVEALRPVVHAVGMAVIRNPFAGHFVDDLRPLFEAGAMLGGRLMPDLVKLLDGPAVFLRERRTCRRQRRDGTRWRLRTPDARRTDAGRDRRWQGGNILERQGRCGGHQPRRAARA